MNVHLAIRFVSERRPLFIRYNLMDKYEQDELGQKLERISCNSFLHGRSLIVCIHEPIKSSLLSSSGLNRLVLAGFSISRLLTFKRRRILL